MSTQRNGMTGARWRELIARKPPKPHYLHISCDARMVADPRGAQYPAIPRVQKPGATYSVGMTNNKRRLRQLRADIRRTRRMAKHFNHVQEEIQRAQEAFASREREVRDEAVVS